MESNSQHETPVGSTLIKCHTPMEMTTTNFQKRNLYDRYTNFIDSSKTILEHYQKKKFYSGQEKHIHKINSWLEDDSQPNKPLVFKTEPGCGIKTILSNWEKCLATQNQHKKEKILNIMHFTSNGSNHTNYYYSLYRIIIKLREALKLKQNVDLLEENIRKFFKYWLDLCSSEVERQLIIYCAQDIYHKVVIVIEGVDQFIDPETGKQANIPFWLPESFPKNVKVILTATKGSESLEHLEKLKCQIIDIRYDSGIAEAIFNDVLKKQSLLENNTFGKYCEMLEYLYNKISSTTTNMNATPNSQFFRTNFNPIQNNVYTFLEVFSGMLMPKKPLLLQNNYGMMVWKQVLERKVNFQKLKETENIKDLYNFIINLASEIETTSPSSSLLKTKIQLGLTYLSLTQKGLTMRELMMLTKMSQKQFSIFEMIFSSMMIKYENIYSIKSTSFIRTILERDRIQKEHGGSVSGTVKSNTQSNYNEILMGYHEKIAKALDSTENCIRKLEEQTYHLFVSKSYFKLKEIISNIENFLLLFNPNNKYELSRYWQKLEEKGFDPVIEYNKAVEGFSMHYHPSDQNIFRIIVQISRFLKEFCDFQTYQTPNFRHPYIEGNMVQLQKIGLLKQLSNLQIYIDNSFNNEQCCAYDFDEEFTLEQQIKELKEKYFPKEHLENNNKHKESTPQNLKLMLQNAASDFDKMNNNQPKILRKSDNIKILSDIEQLNVDVPMNRNKFRNYYLKSLKEFMKQEENSSFENQNKGFEVYLDVEDHGNAAMGNQATNGISFTKIRQNYRLRPIKSSLYYYKRWIWIQFPWVCISLNNNYSTTPELRKKIEGDDYDTLELESKYTKQALLVAIEAREKKKQMLIKKDGDGFQSSKGFNRSKNMFSISKFGSKLNGSSGLKEKLSLKNSGFVQLSLQNLTKQLETRKKKLKMQDVSMPVEMSSNFFLSEINDNCHQDMKFISLRRQFEKPNTNNLQPNEVLPKLKWVIKEHTNYELTYIKNHIDQKKKKLNKIIYQNTKLLQVYQELRIKENLSQQNMNQHQHQKYSRKNKALDDLLKKKEEVITEFCKSLLEKERLKIILKICSENKTKNQEYLYNLNYLLQNLQKMITHQKENMKFIIGELEQFKIQNQKQNVLYLEKQKNKKIIEKEAENYIEQKNKIQREIENIEFLISEDIKTQKVKLQYSLNGEMKNKEQKNQIKEQQKTTKQLEEKYHKVSEEYQKLRQLFEFEDFDFERSQKFKNLLEENEKNKKLKIAYFERKNKLEEVTRLLEKTKEENEKQVQNEIKKMTVIQKQSQPKEVKRNESLNSQNKMEIFLDNICLKLGVKSKDDILPCLKLKLNQLQTHHPDKYAQIMNPNHTRPFF